MRLWSLHPRYLDSRGLVALWREGLLAQAVLKGETRGYKHHPQLERFRAHRSPVGAVAEYLRAVHAESVVRGYRFDGSKIDRRRVRKQLEVTSGQLAYEWDWLVAKLRERDPECRAGLGTVGRPGAHPLFRVVRGTVEDWERVPGSG